MAVNAVAEPGAYCRGCMGHLQSMAGNRNASDKSSDGASPLHQARHPIHYKHGGTHCRVWRRAIVSRPLALFQPGNHLHSVRAADKTILQLSSIYNFYELDHLPTHTHQLRAACVKDDRHAQDRRRLPWSGFEHQHIQARYFVSVVIPAVVRWSLDCYGGAVLDPVLLDRPDVHSCQHLHI